MRPGRRDDQLIRRVAVKRTRQIVEFYHHFNVERHNLHYIGSRGFS